MVRASRALLFALPALLPGCMFNWDERDVAELSAGFLEYVDIPVASAGPQPFASSDGECYYLLQSEVRRLRDDSFVADCTSAKSMGVARAAWVDGCELLCVALAPERGSQALVRGIPRALVAVDEPTGVERTVGADLPIIELATAPQAKRAVVGLATLEDESEVYSVIATIDPADGHEYLRQSWEVRRMRGLDCTPDGETFVFSGYVDGVQGVYVGLANLQAVPALLAQDAQNPSISADGTLVAMGPCVPTLLWDSARFRPKASVRILSMRDGATQDIELGTNVIVCGTRFVENPRRLLVTGMRSQKDGMAVWWVIWEIGSDGVATELRTWQVRGGTPVDA